MVLGFPAAVPGVVVELVELASCLAAVLGVPLHGHTPAGPVAPQTLPFQPQTGRGESFHLPTLCLPLVFLPHPLRVHQTSRSLLAPALVVARADQTSMGLQGALAAEAVQVALHAAALEVSWAAAAVIAMAAAHL